MEIWKEVPRWEGLYEVSNLGRVKSLDRLIKRKFYGNYIQKGRILKPSFDKDGYHKYILRDAPINKDFRGHILVAMAFLGHNPDNDKNEVIDHINNIKSDNRLENIQILSIRENNIKSSKNKNEFTGISFRSKRKIYEASISIKKNKIYLGSFSNKETASNAYQKAKKLISNGIKCKEFIKNSVKNIC